MAGQEANGCNNLILVALAWLVHDDDDVDRP